METISLCMIVKNEEKVLDKCLSSIQKCVDEIIIVDTGSSDSTIEIAKKYTDKIYHYKWNNDFSSARNFSLSKATCNYLLWLDADDYIKEEQAKKLLELKKNLNEYDMYYFLYDFDDQYQPFYRERLFSKNQNYQFKGRIHEAIIPYGKTKYENITIHQQNLNKGLTDRNLKIFESFSEDEFTPRDYYYYARELYRHSKIEDAIYYFQKFLKCPDGYFENKIDACYLLGSIYTDLNQYDEALKVLFLTFNEDLPRSNVLCSIANIYLLENKIQQAIYYYELALEHPYSPSISFVHKDYLDYIPAIQLCVCYDKLKNYEKAFFYNELSNKYKPNQQAYQINKQYLQQKLK